MPKSERNPDKDWMDGVRILTIIVAIGMAISSCFGKKEAVTEPTSKEIKAAMNNPTAREKQLPGLESGEKK